MDFSNPYNLIILFVVVVFWGAVILLSRAKRRATSPLLLILPAFFLVAGASLNRVHMPWGTYAIGLIHVMMLPALLKIANSNR